MMRDWTRLSAGTLATCLLGGMLLLSAHAQEPPETPEAEEPEAPAAEVPEAPAAGPVTYSVTEGATTLDVLVRYDRSALIAGHDHIIQSANTSGSVVWDTSDPTACQVELTFPVSSLTVDPGNTRTKYGFEGTTSDGDKRKIRDNMLGKRQLDASTFPKITFTSKSCQAAGDRIQVEGALTVHGVTKVVKSNMSLTADADGFQARGSFKANHADFGMSPFTALLGSLRNADELEFHVNVSAKP